MLGINFSASVQPIVQQLKSLFERAVEYMKLDNGKPK